MNEIKTTPKEKPKISSCNKLLQGHDEGGVVFVFQHKKLVFPFTPHFCALLIPPHTHSHSLSLFFFLSLSLFCRFSQSSMKHKNVLQQPSFILSFFLFHFLTHNKIERKMKEYCVYIQICIIILCDTHKIAYIIWITVIHIQHTQKYKIKALQSSYNKIKRKEKEKLKENNFLW